MNSDPQVFAPTEGQDLVTLHVRPLFTLALHLQVVRPSSSVVRPSWHPPQSHRTSGSVRLEVYRVSILPKTSDGLRTPDTKFRWAQGTRGNLPQEDHNHRQGLVAARHGRSVGCGLGDLTMTDHDTTHNTQTQLHTRSPRSWG